MIWRHLPVVVLLAGVSSACSFIPDYMRPAAPVPGQFPHAEQTAASSTPLDAVAWRDYFADAQLREVIALALQNNRDLRVAALNIDKARALYRIQRADLYPSVGITGSETAQRVPKDLAGGNEADTTHQYSVNLGFSSYEIDFFGRIRSLNQQALELYLGTEEAKRSAQISLVAEVANAWLTLAADRERLDLSQRTYDTRKKSYELIRRSVEVGVGEAIELRQAETLMEGARAEVALFSARVAQDENALNLLAGASVSAEWLPAKLGDNVSAIAQIPAGVPSEVLTRRPDVLRAERALRASNANIGAARAAFFPTISLTASAGTASAALSGLFAGGSGAWLFLPQIRLPIFEGGRLEANLEAARIEREIKLAEYEKTIQAAFREVADTLAERATLAEQLGARTRLVKATAESYRLSDARYQAGVDSYLASLDAQRTLFDAELALINIRLADAANRVTVYRAFGGGWE